MADATSTLLTRARLPGMTIITGECTPTATTSTLRTGLKIIDAVNIDYAENPGANTVPYWTVGSNADADKITITSVTQKKIAFTVYGRE